MMRQNSGRVQGSAACERRHMSRAVVGTHRWPWQAVVYPTKVLGYTCLNRARVFSLAGHTVQMEKSSPSSEYFNKLFYLSIWFKKYHEIFFVLCLILNCLIVTLCCYKLLILESKGRCHFKKIKWLCKQNCDFDYFWTNKWQADDL